jgi:hypothetical protein
MNANQFPALNGETVTEAHAAFCAERGHATHTVDGVDTGVCPRCGEVKGADAEMAEKFERMLFLEDRSKTFRALAVMGSNAETRKYGERDLKKVKAELFELLDTLTSAEFEMFKGYRKFHK